MPDRCARRGRRAALVRLGALGLAALAPPLAAQRTPTRSTAAGPDYRPGAPDTTTLWRAGDPGDRLHLRGRVLGTTGRPLPGALVEVWQADGAGSYHPDRYRAAFRADGNGRFKLDTAVPGQSFGAKHIHVAVTAPGHERLVTRVLFRNDPALDEQTEGDLAILLEKVQAAEGPALVGSVELVLRRGGGG